MIARPADRMIRQWAGAPILWFDLARPAKTFASDAGDVADLRGRCPAGVRQNGCTLDPDGDGYALSPGPSGSVRLDTPPMALTDWTVTARIVLPPDAPPGIQRVFTQQAGNYWGLVVRDRRVTALSGHDGVVYPTGTDFGPDLADGREHRIAAARDTLAGLLTLYVDGLPVKALPASSGGAYDDATPCWISSYIGNPTECFTGKIRGVAVHDYALTAAAIARDAADPSWRTRPARTPWLLAAGPSPAPTPRSRRTSSLRSGSRGSS